MFRRLIYDRLGRRPLVGARVMRPVPYSFGATVLLVSGVLLLLAYVLGYLRL